MIYDACSGLDADGSGIGKQVVFDNIIMVIHEYTKWLTNDQ